jgi:hypothetical protein
MHMHFHAEVGTAQTVTPSHMHFHAEVGTAQTVTPAAGTRAKSFGIMVVGVVRFAPLEPNGMFVKARLLISHALDLLRALCSWQKSFATI